MIHDKTKSINEKHLYLHVVKHVVVEVVNNDVVTSYLFLYTRILRIIRIMMTSGATVVHVKKSLNSGSVWVPTFRDENCGHVQNGKVPQHYQHRKESLKRLNHILILVGICMQKDTYKIQNVSNSTILLNLKTVSSFIKFGPQIIQFHEI